MLEISIIDNVDFAHHGFIFFDVKYRISEKIVLLVSKALASSFYNALPHHRHSIPFEGHRERPSVGK